MKQYKWLVTLLTVFMGIFFFNLNGVTKVKADYGDLYEGHPEFLDDYTFTDKYGGQIEYDSSDDEIYFNSAQNALEGDDLSYMRSSKHVYYISAGNDLGVDGEDSFETEFKIKIVGNDRIKVYYSQNDDGSDMQYWDTYTAE